MATELAPPNHRLYEIKNADEDRGDVFLDTAQEGHLDSGPGNAFLISPTGDQIEIPAELFELVETMVQQIRRGRAIQIVTYNRELTTQQAAEILNVSRQYLIRLLERGEIPFTKTEGSHRRLRLQDVLQYRRRRSTTRRASLDRLARASAELGDYD